ncbi:MAG: ferrous iron transport protein A [Desulfovibrionaceae bacterium]|nr:ferrous iron transport protein A [Desulfovibrionaceae bacterium]MBF0513300.1 ferrous iron transport protein A [Desulfovibrionaceae bacterium]
MNAQVNLRTLRKGQKAVIVSIAAQGELGRRIRDMGLVPGAEIAIVGRAPLRDPVALRVKDFTLSLRNNEADFIEVAILEP